MNSTVQNIWICPKKGMLLTSLQEVEAVKDCGLRGDRWYRRSDPVTHFLRSVNAFIRRRKKVRRSLINVSLISQRALDEANVFLQRSAGVTFTPEETRRNLLIDGDVDLNALVEKNFRIGDVLLRGTVLCTPCRLPPKRAGKLVGREGLFKEAFENRGGVRAHILKGGLISVGDPLMVDLQKTYSYAQTSL